MAHSCPERFQQRLLPWIPAGLTGVRRCDFACGNDLSRQARPWERTGHAASGPCLGSRTPPGAGPDGDGQHIQPTIYVANHGAGEEVTLLSDGARRSDRVANQELTIVGG